MTKLSLSTRLNLMRLADKVATAEHFDLSYHNLCILGVDADGRWQLTGDFARRYSIPERDAYELTIPRLREKSYSDVTAEQAAEVVRRYAATGRVDWDQVLNADTIPTEGLHDADG